VRDPNIRVEIHIKLCEKYLKEGEELLKKGDYVQASEKFWGAASQMIKALAVKKGLELKSHGELHKYVVEIAKQTNKEEIRALWQSAISLHQNFYENWLPPEMVKGNADDIKNLVKKLKELFLE
jgi:uncharacterized protein (UPF0332 family)